MFTNNNWDDDDDEDFEEEFDDYNENLSIQPTHQSTRTKYTVMNFFMHSGKTIAFKPENVEDLEYNGGLESWIVSFFDGSREIIPKDSIERISYRFNSLN
jgi:hypothetical protein